MPFPTELHFVVRAEEALGVRLPDAYREFLLRSNGGQVDTDDDEEGEDYWRIFPVFDDSDRKRAARSANHVVWETAQSRKWRGFPPDAVALGDNGSGDVLVFLPSRDDPRVLAPAVYRWLHETGECEMLSASFEEFAGGGSDV